MFDPMSWHDRETASLGAVITGGGKAEEQVGSLTGRIIGDYAIGENIGAGGNGVVYRAHQQSLDRDVVIKVLRQRARLGRQSQMAARFLREAQLASGLDHPYAAHIYDFGVESDGVMWIAMELVNGTALNRIIHSQGSLPLPRLVPLLDKICEVVHTAHSHGIIHRDLKPSNVMVISRAGQLLPKLLDFGIARRTIRASDPPSPTGAEHAAERGPEQSQRQPQRQPPEDPGHSQSDEGDNADTTWTRTDTSSGDLARSRRAGSISDSEPHLGREGSDRLTHSTGPRLSPVSLLASAGHAGDTPEGASLGSPLYMAPEQWRDAAHADERADQYSLGILTYEALTGRLPFASRSTRKMAAAHSYQPVPDMGPEFSPELQAVVFRALAKNPADRYDDVMAFARALRAMMPLESQGHPRLSIAQNLLHLYLEKAPQPLADAVATLDAATDRQRTGRAISEVIRVGFSMLATIALAAVARLGTELTQTHGVGAQDDDDALDNGDSNGDGDSDRDDDGDTEALAILRRMRRQRLDTRGCLTLAHGLSQPFAEEPDAYLVPELVLLLRDRRPRLARLATRGDSAARLAELPPDDMQSLASELEWFLGELAFLCDYPLVVCADGRLEAWYGARRAIHPFHALASTYQPAEGEILLTGATREPVLILNPLIQKLQPAPLRPHELFMLAGGSRYGALMVASPAGFQRYARDVWPWLEQRIPGIADTEGRAADEPDADESPPYMGLSAFSRADADRFFGREREVQECVNRLRVESLLAIVGPSGAGKSSFVQAGILPVLSEHYRVAVIRPGSQPIAALAACHEQLRLATPLDTEELTRDSESLGRALRSSAGPGEILVLVVDQFEELVTLCADPAVQRQYAALLMGAAGRAHERVRVIVTLRDDFLLRVQKIGPLSERLGSALVLLSTPPAEELERILCEPARHVGYEFDDSRLPAEMVAAVAAEPGALALLSFTASRLWERRDRQFKRLQRRVYDDLGGVGGALGQHAESVLAAMTEDQRDSVREIFRQLVTADGTRAILTRSELFELLGGPEAAQPVLESLIGARLLVAREGGGDASEADQGQSSERIEVVHEALLSSWPRLVDWQREDAENARLRDQLRAAARQWDERERPKGLLWRADALMEYRVWRARYPGALTRVEANFAAASVREDERGRNLRRLLWVSALVAMAMVVVVVIGKNRDISAERDRAAEFARQAEKNAREAAAFATESSRRLVAMQREQGRQALLAGQPMRAFAYLRAALEGAEAGGAPKDLTTRFMLGRAVDALADQELVIRAHEGNVMAVEFSPDGRFLGTGGTDHKARIWDAQTGALVHTLADHTDKVWSLEFDAAGERLATASWDNTAIVWDVATGARLWTAEHEDNARSVMFSADGERLLTTSKDKKARVWNARDGQLIQTLVGHTGPLWTGAIDASGRYVVTGSVDQTARLWEVNSGRQLLATETLGLPVGAVAFAPDGSAAAIASFSGVAQVLPVGERITRTQVVNLLGHTAMIVNVAFSPSSSRVVTTSADGSVRQWNPRTGELLATISAHPGGALRALFAPQGQRLFTLGEDGTAKAWSADGKELLWTYHGHTNTPWSGSISDDGTRLVTADFDGIVRVWAAEMTVHSSAWTAAEPDGEVPAIRQAAMTPDGRHVAAFATDGTIQIWTRSGEFVRSLAGSVSALVQHGVWLTWHPDGTRLLSAGGAVAHQWNAMTGAQLHTFDEGSERVGHATYTSDGARIVTASDDGSIRVRDSRSGELLATLTGHAAPVQFLAISPDGQRLASASHDRSVRFWNLAMQQPETLRIDKQQLVSSVRFDPTGARVVVSSMGKTVDIHDARTGELLVALDGHTASIQDAQFSPDGHLVLTVSSDHTWKVWDASSGAMLWTQSNQHADAPMLGFTPDGDHALGGSGERVKLWPIGYEQRNLHDLDAYARCRVNYALEDERIERVNLDHAGCSRP